MRRTKRGQEQRAWKPVLDEDLRAAHQSQRKRAGICQALHFSHFYPRHCPDLRELSCSDNLFLTCRKLAVLSCTKQVCQLWLYLSPPSASTHSDAPWKDVTQHSLNQTLQSAIAEQWHSCAEALLQMFLTLLCHTHASRWGGERCSTKSFRKQRSP